jgi:chromosome segregation ATPase
VATLSRFSKWQRNELNRRLFNLSALFNDLEREKDFIRDKRDELKAEFDLLEKRFQDKSIDYLECITRIKDLTGVILLKDREIERRPNITKKEFQDLENQMDRLEKRVIDNNLCI